MKKSMSSLEKRIEELEKLLECGNKIFVYFAGSEPDTKENETDVRRIALRWPDVSSKKFKSEEKDDIETI